MKHMKDTAVPSMSGDTYDEYQYLTNWDAIREQQGWEAYLDWCRRNENGPHE